MQFIIYIINYYFLACIYIAVLCEKEIAPRVIDGPSNATTFVDRNLTLMCTVTGRPRPKVSWSKRNSTMARFVEVQFNSRVKIMKNGRLFITRLLVSDTGFYRCSAENIIDTVFSSNAYVNIQAKVTMIEGPKSQTVVWGSNVSLKCEVIGIPFPQRSWYKNSLPILDPLNDKIYSRPIYIINATETASYECRAENVHNEGYSIVNKTAVITVSAEFCNQLDSSVCNLEGNIFLNASNSWTLKDKETDLKDLFETLPSHDDGFCKENAIPIFCSFVFPKCGGDSQKPVHLCRESCLAVRDLFCKDWWKSHIIPSSPFLLDCNKLTSRYDHSSNCIYINLFQIDKSATNTCIHGKGQYYYGHTNVTSSGIECQSWVDQFPHRHSYNPLVYPPLEGAYCRNVGGEKNRPWCFTTNESIPWQYCDINICQTTTPINEIQPELNKFWKYFAFIMTFLLIFIIILISIYFARHCYKKYRANNKCEDKLESLENIPLNNIPDVLTAGMMTEQRPSIVGFEDLEIERNCIEHIDDIALGAFGQLFKAKFRNKENNSDKVFVVRMLNDKADEYMEGEFVRQAGMLLHLNHPNIIPLLHVCFAGKPLCVLIEYMQNKDLCDYLTKDPPTDYKTKLSIIRQMASVVEYLASKRIIHRDLAARNFLVSAKEPADPIVKLSDVGLAVYLGEEEPFYFSDEKELVPIRWTAPEAILYSTFTFASDIWSLGVAMWEVLANGAAPYSDLSTIEEVSDFVLERNVLDCPQLVYSEVYEKVLLVWWI